MAAIKNRSNMPVLPLRPNAELMVPPTSRVFAKGWIQFFRNLWTAVVNLQQSSPYVVVTSVTSAYTAEPGELVICDPTSASFTVALPSTTSPSSREHMQVDVKHDSDSANTVTVSATDIDGAATFVLKAREDITCNRVPNADRWVIR